LRAGMVADLQDYPWSSYAAHGLGLTMPLLSEAPVWAGLARTEEARQAFWRKWVHEPWTERELAAVRRSVTSGRPFGRDSWVKSMAQGMGFNLTPKRRGRPPKKPDLEESSEKMN
jgi:putative transposase